MLLPALSTTTPCAIANGTTVAGVLAYRHLTRSAAAPACRIEPHEADDVRSKVQQFAAVAAAVQCEMAVRVTCEEVDDDAAAGPGQKILHLIRHGEGVHNVAQREWRQAAAWDRATEPYTLDTDPSGRYTDAELTPTGVQQAVALRLRTAHLRPGLLVVSPLRRATKTGLLAFEEHVGCGLCVLAHELLHETAGSHTCDRRLSRTDLAAAFPAVDYSLLVAEEDPYWGDGLEREEFLSLAKRAAALAEWLATRTEGRIAVASHSGFICALMTCVLSGPHALASDRAWFGTGEMRTLRLTFS